jgi:hypothetical protein
MERDELTKYTNLLFKLYIADVLRETNLTLYALNKQLNLPINAINEKLRTTCRSFVSLPFIYLIASHTGITFDLLKYDTIHKENLAKL